MYENKIANYTSVFNKNIKFENILRVLNGKPFLDIKNIAEFVKDNSFNLTFKVIMLIQEAYEKTGNIINI